MTYFDARGLPAARAQYVCWVDVMGMEAQMKRSIQVSANFVFKLHVAALAAATDKVMLYPIMDGLYACADTRADIEQFLTEVFRALVDLFSREKAPAFRFIARGAIAYGDVYHGREISNDASARLADRPEYRASIMLGPPIVDANRAEEDAPPFGIAIHPSARLTPKSGEHPYNRDWWPWWEDGFDGAGFMKRLEAHYEWCRNNSTRIGYLPSRIVVHEALATRYFLHS
jgi:hypothetical protein